MKKLMLALGFLLFAGFGFAQTKATWKEMKDFHAVMSKSFHPTEEGNFKPLKENASLLVTRAQDWQKSAVPMGYNAAVAKPLLAKLVKQAKVVQKAVKKNKSDEVLKAEIIKAHDIFHELTEKCTKESEESHEGHNH